MDPLTIAGSGGTYVALLLILILWSLAIRADERGANVLVTGETNEPGQDQPRPTRNFLSRIRTNELLVLQCLSMVGVPLLMIAFSVAVPALRNPLFLMIGALAGFVLPRSWLGGSTFGRIALVAGLILAALWIVLVLMLQGT
jgi:hypothetical protein